MKNNDLKRIADALELLTYVLDLKTIRCHGTADLDEFKSFKKHYSVQPPTLYVDTPKSRPLRTGPGHGMAEE